MGMTMDQDKLKALAAELTKDIKSEKDLGALTQQLVKLTVETALNSELDDGRFRVSVAHDDSAEIVKSQNYFPSWDSAASYIANSLFDDIQILTQIIHVDPADHRADKCFT
ncbi:MAG: hypothetical protein ACI89D_000540 [Bermanella sp.]|jgi:hypothetical protein